jgi:hypothetical protein
VNVVIHVFDTESRDFYDLDLLWGDSPRIDWRKELGRPPEEERRTRPLMARSDEMEPEDAMEGVAEEDDEEPGEEPPVEVEMPDESTGSNSVEFLEIDAPGTRKLRGHVRYPTPVAESEDTTEEERAIAPMSSAAAAAEEAEEEEEAAARPAKKAKKANKANRAKTVVRKKPAVKAVKKKSAKKPAAKKTAKAKPAKKKTTRAKPAAKSRKKK